MDLNPIQNVIEIATRDIILPRIVDAIDAAAVAQFPFLGLPVVHTVFRYYLEKSKDKLWDEFRKFESFKFIDLGEQQKFDALKESEGKLRESLNASPEDQMAALAEYKKHLHDLVTLPRAQPTK